jgi:hypothetical protein
VNNAPHEFLTFLPCILSCYCLSPFPAEQCWEFNLDTDTQDPLVLGLSGSISQRYGSGSGSFPFLLFILHPADDEWS